MNGFLKLLIGVACLVVIAGGVVWYLRDRDRRQEQEAAANEAAAIEGCRFTLTKAGAGLGAMRGECLANGHITGAEFQRATEGQFVEN